MKKIFTLILIGVALVGSYILLNRNYMEGVNACIDKGNDINYCEYHAG